MPNTILSLTVVLLTGCRVALQAQPLAGQRHFLDVFADVTESTGHVYSLRDSQGNSMDALQVIEDDERGYLGVYHTYKDGVFTANLARSPDLLNWRFQTAIGQ